MNIRQQRLGEFVVACGDAPEMLEPCKEALDQIASAIEMPIELARCQGKMQTFADGGTSITDSRISLPVP